ncbi:hypothetical protein JTE90_021041 [Oedothorax gibbosus]|uniref:Thioredoxin domain-containing protein 17 n=1 Tax=Oedothorax gibbosus TaxID=931172 RepID=A0AAV6VSJ3_9ARAC|nr:hypothetical protein JTE90_021041 [Oedothorax gibbosus]
MVKRINVEGFDAVQKAIRENSKSDSLFVLFSGAKNSRGESWCPDCVAAEPIIEEGLKIAPESSVFIYCSVGDRNYWKNPNNEFRKDEKFKLTSVPTLMKWNTARRLDDEQCKSAALVTMLFEE